METFIEVVLCITAYGVIGGIVGGIVLRFDDFDEDHALAAAIFWPLTWVFVIGAVVAYYVSDLGKRK